MFDNLKSLRLLTLSLIVLLASCKSSTPSDSGKTPVSTFTILDKYTGKPLQGVMVTLANVSPGWSKVTDVNGDAKYDGNAFGNYFVFTLYYPHYISQKLTLDIFSDKTFYDTIFMVNPNDFLEAAYRFSGSMTDSSGRGHDGINHGSSFTADRFGNASSALQLNGTTNYVSIPDASGLNFGKTTDFSMSVWYNQSSSQSNPFGYYLNKSTSAPFTGYSYGLEATQVGTHLGTTFGEVSHPYPLPSPDSRWHHIVLVVSRLGNIQYYFDGVLYKEFPGSDHNLQGNMDASSDLLIGGTGSASSAFRGKLDDIQIFRTALSDSVVFQLYHEKGW